MTSGVELVDLDTVIFEKISETITTADWASKAFRRVYENALHAIEAGLAVELILNPIKKTRSLEQNAHMWTLLRDLSKQIVWYGNKLTSEEWKDVISASLSAQKTVPGIAGGFVVLGMSTRRMSIKDMSLMIEACLAFGSQQGVRFSAPKWMYEERGGASK